MRARPCLDVTEARVGDGHLDVEHQEERDVLAIRVGDVGEPALARGLRFGVVAALVEPHGLKADRRRPPDEASRRPTAEHTREHPLVPVAAGEGQRHLGQCERRAGATARSRPGGASRSTVRVSATMSESPVCSGMRAAASHVSDLPRRADVRGVQLDLLAVLGRDRELAAVRVVEEAQVAGDHRVELEARGVERVGALQRGAPVFAVHRERARGRSARR